MKAARKAYKVAEEAHARAKQLQDSAALVEGAEREEMIARANAAVAEANVAQEKWDSTYASAKEAMKALETTTN